MSIFVPDTSCMIAALCSWHEHEQSAIAEMDRRLDHGDELVVAAPALVEAYSVLTRLPRPFRLSPETALALLERSFLQSRGPFALQGATYRALLREAAANSIAGGRMYDAVIARCALEAGATTLLTFNASHFQSFAARGLAIVIPTA